MKKIILAIISVLMILTIVGCSSNKNADIVLSEGQKYTINYKIVAGDDKIFDKQIVVEKDSEANVHEVLVAILEKEGISYDDNGGFINTIGDYEGGTSWWLYQVNGEKATVGSTEYLLKNNDSIVWEFTTL